MYGLKRRRNATCIHICVRLVVVRGHPEYIPGFSIIGWVYVYHCSQQSLTLQTKAVQCLIDLRPLRKTYSTLETTLFRIWQVSVWDFQPDGVREVERPGCRADAGREEMHLTCLGRVLSGARVCVCMLSWLTERSRLGES